MKVSPLVGTAKLEQTIFDVQHAHKVTFRPLFLESKKRQQPTNVVLQYAYKIATLGININKTRSALMWDGLLSELV